MILHRKGYSRLRLLRIVVSLAVMVATAITVGLGYDCFLSKWQLVPAALVGAGEWLLMWAAVTALFGRLYCSTACPLGTLQDCLIRLRRRRRGFFHSPARPMLRWFFVIVIVAAAILGIGFLVRWLDPSQVFAFEVDKLLAPWISATAFSLATGIAAVVVLAVIAAIAIMRGRLLCNTLCPVGTVLGAFSRLSLFQIDINTDKCTGCGLCTARCKAECIDPQSHTVDFSRCVVCFDCVASCPNDAITMRRGRHQLQWPMLQEIAPEPTAFKAPEPDGAKS